MTALQLQYRNYVETQRSNLAKEFETKRHNVRLEDLEERKQSESERHNLVAEEQNKFQSFRDLSGGAKDFTSAFTNLISTPFNIAKTVSDITKNKSAAVADGVKTVATIVKLIPTN